MSEVVDSGLWTVEFGSSLGKGGGGVFMINGSRLTGGDSTHYYIGEIKQHEEGFSAELDVRPFVRNAPSVFGLIYDHVTLDLVGHFSGETGSASGHVREYPNMSFGAQLRRVLP